MQIAKKINHIHREFVEEAFAIYKESGLKLGKKPHPNYFVAIAVRLHLDKRQNYEYNTAQHSRNLGKGI